VIKKGSSPVRRNKPESCEKIPLGSINKIPHERQLQTLRKDRHITHLDKEGGEIQDHEIVHI